MKTIGLIFISMVFVAGAWGYYYYQELYIPSVYAAAAVPLYQPVSRVISTLHSFPLADEMDFDKAEQILNEQCPLVASLRQSHSLLHPSAHTQALHQYFAETLELLGRACQESLDTLRRAGALMNFFAEFEKIFTAIEQVGSSSDRPVQTLGDLKMVWEGQMKKAHDAGEKAFSRPLEGIDQTIKDILMGEWQRIRPSLDTVLLFLKNLTLPASLPLEQVESRIPRSQIKPVEEAMKTLEASRRVMSEIRQKPELFFSALDIVNFRFVKDVSQAELSVHLYILDEAMKELDARY